jgi:hypothetical protein
MPVEILEIVVRANVQEQPAHNTTAASNGAGPGEVQQQQIIEEAVEQMLEILRRKEER